MEKQEAAKAGDQDGGAKVRASLATMVEEQLQKKHYPQKNYNAAKTVLDGLRKNRRLLKGDEWAELRDQALSGDPDGAGKRLEKIVYERVG